MAVGKHIGMVGRCHRLGNNMGSLGVNFLAHKHTRTLGSRQSPVQAAVIPMTWILVHDLLSGEKIIYTLALLINSVYSVFTEKKEIMLKLTSVQKKFILHWGEMGTRWGINRSVAQIHALLYIWPESLNAEQITKTLSIARSNVSNSLKELQAWGLVKNIHVMGDRRDHFETLEDVWEMFRVIMDERKRREMDPTVALLRDCLDEQKKSGKHDKHTEERLVALRDFFESGAACYDRVRTLSTSTLRKLSSMGDKVLKLLQAV